MVSSGMAGYPTKDRICIFPYVMGKGVMAACQTGSIDVAVLEGIDADRSDQCGYHRYCDNGIRRKRWV